MRPTGSNEQTGGHSKHRINLTDGLQTSFDIAVGSADNVLEVDQGRVDYIGTGEVERGCTLCTAACDDGSDQFAVRIEGEGVVLVKHQRGLCCRGEFDDNAVLENAKGLKDGLLVIDGCVLRLCRSLVNRRVEDIHEDNRGNILHIEAGVDALAESVLLPVIRIADSGTRLLVGVAQLRGIHRPCRVVHEVDRGSSEDDLQSGSAGDRCGQTGFLLGYIDAMFIRHISLPP